MDIANRLLATDRLAALRCMSAAINELTVLARASYDEIDSREHLVRTNEAIHRLAGHLRDLCDPGEALTTSRAQGIEAAVALLSGNAVSRLLHHSPL